MDDAKIITLFWNRDERAITEFTASHKRLCVAAANEITGSAHDAEECFADTCLAVWNSIPPENPKPFSSFLYKILRNLSLKKLTFNRAAKRSAIFEELVSEVEEFLPAAETVEGRIEKKELAAAIDEFLATLPPDNRKIFMRRYWFSESYEEIAREMNMSEGSVSMRLVRTRNKMKEFLNERGVKI